MYTGIVSRVEGARKQLCFPFESTCIFVTYDEFAKIQAERKAYAHTYSHRNNARVRHYENYNSNNNVEQDVIRSEYDAGNGTHSEGFPLMGAKQRWICHIAFHVEIFNCSNDATFHFGGILCESCLSAVHAISRLYFAQVVSHLLRAVTMSSKPISLCCHRMKKADSL